MYQAFAAAAVVVGLFSAPHLGAAPSEAEDVFTVRLDELGRPVTPEVERATIPLRLSYACTKHDYQPGGYYTMIRVVTNSPDPRVRVLGDTIRTIPNPNVLRCNEEDYRQTAELDIDVMVYRSLPAFSVVNFSVAADLGKTTRDQGTDWVSSQVASGSVTAGFYLDATVRVLAGPGFVRPGDEVTIRYEIRNDANGPIRVSSVTADGDPAGFITEGLPHGPHDLAYPWGRAKGTFIAHIPSDLASGEPIPDLPVAFHIEAADNRSDAADAWGYDVAFTADGGAGEQAPGTAVPVVIAGVLAAWVLRRRWA